jgi:polyhydroxyalkanoate synthase subunit PhaC
MQMCHGATRSRRMTAPSRTRTTLATPLKFPTNETDTPRALATGAHPAPANPYALVAVRSVAQTKERDSYAVTAIADITDRSLHASIARLTGGLSPAALAQAYLDWATHLAYAPGKRLQLVDKAIRKAIRFATYALRGAVDGQMVPCIERLPQDQRFVGENWQRWPYSFNRQAFLLQQQWWHNATTDVRGISKCHQDMAEFAARQFLDMVSPSVFLLTNPDLLRHKISKGDMNLAGGFLNLVEDWERIVSGKKPVGTERFVVGRDVAVSLARSSIVTA